MNNSRLAQEEVTRSNQAQLDTVREREAFLVKVIEAIKGLEKSNEWSSLKQLVFDGLVEEYRKALFNEARKEAPDVMRIAKLNGKYEVAKKYHDLMELAKTYQTELTNLRIKYGTTPEKPESDPFTGV